MEQIIFKDINWSKFLNEALTCVPYGYSIFEVVHMNRQSKELGAYTGLAQLGFRKQSTITEWTHDEITGELLLVKQEASGDIKVDAQLPAEFLLIFYNSQEGDNIGTPLLRGLFGPYKRKLLATELQYIGVERFAISTPILQIPKNVDPNDAEYVAAIEALKSFTAAEDSYITYPEGWVLELNNNNTFDPSKIQVVIQAENENMSGAILASFLELGTGGNGGAFALANDQSDFFLDGLNGFADSIKDTINKCLIPQLMKLNFGDDDELVPQLVYSGISDKAGKELMEVITGYTSASVVTVDEPLEDYVRKVNNLPKKAEGSMIDNQESEDGGGTDPTPPGEAVDDVEVNSNSNSDPDPVDNEPTLKLADDLGHTHKGTGPAVKRGAKHYHELLDPDGNAEGRTKTESDNAGHTHVIDSETNTGKPIETKPIVEAKENPKKIIQEYESVVTDIIRRNLKIITDKYIADGMRNYQKLDVNKKLTAFDDVKVGGVNQFKKELKAALTGAANDSLKQARTEVPDKANVKLADDMEAIKLEFKNADTFKFNDFSKLPRRIQILLNFQVEAITEQEVTTATNTVAFQFHSSESSTNDPAVITSDLKEKAETQINSGTKDTAAATSTSTIVNESRNSFILAPEVSESVASYTFINYEPVAAICVALKDSTYAVGSPDLIRLQPPLHQSCKSYIRANLKIAKKQPDITGLPVDEKGNSLIGEKERKSITLKED